MPKKNLRSQSQKLRWQKLKEADCTETAEQVHVPQNKEQVLSPENRVGGEHRQHRSYADVLRGSSPTISAAPSTSQQVNQSEQHVSDVNVTNVAGLSHEPSINAERAPSVTSVCASVSQNSNMFGKYRNKQCTTNSLVFLSFLYESESINTSDLNLVLNKGHVMYSERRILYPQSVFLATDELPHEVSARRTRYHVDMSQNSLYGTFAGGECPSLEEGLNSLSSDVQYAVLIMASLCIAVFRCRSGHYGFFDPHSRSSDGFPSRSRKSGTAVMLKFTCLRDMIDRIKTVFMILKVSQSTLYELKPVEFYRSAGFSLTDAVNRERARDETENMLTSTGTTTAQEHEVEGTPLTHHSPLNEVNMTAEVMNQKSPCADSITPSETEQETFNQQSAEPSRNDDQRLTTVTNSITQQISPGLSKRNKQERKKLQRRLTVSQKPLQRKENQKNKERLLYASDKTFKMKKMAYYQDSPDVRQRQSLYNKNIYRNDPKVRQKKQEFIRKSYSEKPEFRERQKLRINNLYKTQEHFRQEQKLRMSHLYKTQEQFRQEQKLRMSLIYKTQEQVRQKQKLRKRHLYKTQEQFRQKEKLRMLHLYKTQEQVRQKQKLRKRHLYKTQEQFRQKEKLRMLHLYKTQEQVRQKQKLRMLHLYKTQEQVRQKQKLRVSLLYKECEAFRMRQRTYVTQRYANDTTFRLRHRQIMKLQMRKLYNNSEQFRKRHNSRCAMKIKRKYRQMSRQTASVQRQTENSQINESVSLFRSNIQAGPTYVCTVCEKASFKNQVKVCRRSNYNKNPAVTTECLIGKHVHVCTESCNEGCSVPDERKTEWICHTCHNYVKKGYIPNLAVANQMGLADIPEELKDLNILERHLIAKCIPFAKIIPLPKGRQRLIRGNVVCVPSEVQETVEALPRLRNESQVLRVKLKRRLCYKGHQLFQTVTWSKLIQALNKLKQIHPQYADVTIRDEALLCDPTIPDDDDDDEDVNMQHDDYDEADLIEIDLIEQQALCDVEGDSGSEHDVDMMSCDGQEAEHVENDEDSQTDEEQEGDLPNGGYAIESCLQPVDVSEEILSYTDGIFCVAPAERNNPISFFRTPHLEAIAFPAQFPDGKNTLDEHRRIKVTPSSYFKSRLFNIDERFARDPNYLFFAQFVTEIHLANSSMTVQLRKTKTTTKDGRRITSGMLQNKTEVQRLVRNKDAVRFMQPLRGTPAYWEKTTKDLFAMIRQLGSPTFFCTFSAAEMRWPEVIQAIKRQQGEEVDFEALDWTEKCDILRSNPVTCMRMFDKRVESLFRDLLLSPAQPLGEIIDYFYRVEFQHRGSPHIHAMCWTSHAPDLEVDDDQTVCDFVDRYISVQLPDPDRQPDLHKKVTELQKHSKNHTKTCFKSVNSGCRFGFPKPPCRKTMIVRCEEDQDTAAAKQKLRPLMELLNEPEVASLTLQQILSRCNLTLNEYERCLQSMNKKTALILKREPAEIWINNYNPVLLKAWDANIDVSFILNAYSCVQYLTKYITKKESGLSEYLKTVIDSSDKDRVNECDEMRAVMQAYSKKREISAQECVTRACGLKMKKSSRAVIFIPTDESPVRMSRPMSFLETTTPDSHNIWMTNLIDKYKSRPETPEYEEMCLADFAATCRFVSSQHSKRKGVLPLLNQLGYVQKRKTDKPSIIRYYQCSKEKRPEQFYGTLLRLYLPHRSQQQLKTQNFPTYESFYNSGWVRLPGSDHPEYVKLIVLRNKDKYEKNSEDIAEALAEYEESRDVVVDEWCNLAPESNVVRLQCDEQLNDHPDDDNEQENVPDFSRQSDAVTEVRAVRQTPAIDPSVLRQMYQNLNQKQACVFYAVRDWCLQRVCGSNPEPFFFYVNGGAGTGKSHLIKCIHSEASKILSRLPSHSEETDISKPTVLLTSFTGTAAFNISGTTLHSLLKLPRSLKPPIQGLGNQLDEVRCELFNAEILVIDEISMVSKPLFLYVDARLKQIKGSPKPFGGMSVLAVGDFYQLPPVRQSKPLCVHDLANIDLWYEHFQMITLTQIMRQKDDVAFAEMLNRIRVKEKTDELSEADRDLLSHTVTEPELCPTDVLHIFATNKRVEAHNAETLERFHTNIINIDAHDFQKDPRSGRMAQQDTPVKGGRDCLPDTLKMAEGARVMLTRNIDIPNGLVNGAFGKLVKVVRSENDPESITKLGVRMDNGSSVRNSSTAGSESDDLVYIDRAEEKLKHRGMIRRQFPVKLAFACTVHKTQGLTTQAAVVSLKNIFEPGMAYVALSRVTSLNGLYLLDFDQDKIYANREVTAALQTMKQANVDNMMPLLFQQTVTRPDGLIIIHHNTEGLPAHINDIKRHHELCLADVLCLTETHLQGSFVADSLQLDGYTMFKRNRHVSYSNFPQLSTRGGGGVAVYVKNHVRVHEKQYLHNVTDLEFLVLKVETPFPALIAVVYRPPDYSLGPFMENLVNLLNSLELMDCQPIIVCGDFNENQMLAGRKQILELFQSRGFTQLITSATTEKNTLIDLVFISQPQRSPCSGVLRTYYSYHNPVYCVMSSPQS